MYVFVVLLIQHAKYSLKKQKKSKTQFLLESLQRRCIVVFPPIFHSLDRSPFPVLALTEQQCNKITKVTPKYTYYTTHYIWSRTLWLLESTECPILAEHWTNKPLPQPLTSPRQNQQANTHLNESSTTTYWIR